MIPENAAPILSQASNLGVVHMPGRNYPGVVIQGDSLLLMLSEVNTMVRKLKQLGCDEDSYIEALGFFSRLRGMMIFYEETLERLGHPKVPWAPTRERDLDLEELDSLLGYPEGE